MKTIDSRLTRLEQQQPRIVTERPGQTLTPDQAVQVVDILANAGVDVEEVIAFNKETHS